LERECLAALTLRRVAREAGVSQAAPYSHFKDKKALLAAVAIEGFERFDKLMKEYAAKEETYIIGLGMGYIQFALAHPALFHLMFNNDLVELIEICSEDIAYNSSYETLVAAVNKTPLLQFGESNPQLDTVFLWSLVYGLANLWLAERIHPTAYGFADNESFLRQLLEKYLR
jgi:AcrR family transcriptional regulator